MLVRQFALIFNSVGRDDFLHVHSSIMGSRYDIVLSYLCKWDNCVELNGDKITISSNIVVTKKQNVLKENCVLYLQNNDKNKAKKYTKDQIVQLALEPLFFK